MINMIQNAKDQAAALAMAAYQAAATRKSPLEDPERDMLEKIQE